MTYQIGEILKGTIGGDNATFEVVKIKECWDGEAKYVLECVDHGAPRFSVTYGQTIQA